MTILLFVVCFAATAQKSNWTLFAGWNQSVGDFAKVDLQVGDWAFNANNSTKGGMGLGVSIGATYRRPLDEINRFSLVLGTDVQYTISNYIVTNNSSGFLVEARKQFDKARVVDPSFITVPVMAGLHFETGLKGYRFYIEAQAGLAYRKATNRILELSGSTTPIEIDGVELYEYCYTDHFFGSASPAYRFSLGIVENVHWVFDVGFCYMGDMTIEGYEDFSLNTTTNPANRIQTSMSFTAGHVSPMLVTLKVGYRL